MVLDVDRLAYCIYVCVVVNMVPLITEIITEYIYNCGVANVVYTCGEITDVEYRYDVLLVL